MSEKTKLYVKLKHNRATRKFLQKKLRALTPRSTRPYRRDPYTYWTIDCDDVSLVKCRKKIAFIKILKDKCEANDTHTGYRGLQLDDREHLVLPRKWETDKQMRKMIFEFLIPDMKRASDILAISGDHEIKRLCGPRRWAEIWKYMRWSYYNTLSPLAQDMFRPTIIQEESMSETDSDTIENYTKEE